jgi:hypothetical protein
VAALDVGGVVLVGQRPTDPLGHPRRHGHRHGAPGPQHSGEFGDGGVVLDDVLEDLGGDDPVEAAVGEREPPGVTVHRRPGPARRELSGVGHRREQPGDVLELAPVEVEGDDPSPSPGRLEGVAAGATAEIEHPVTGAQPEPAVADGQHGRRTPRSASSAR